MKIGNFEIIRRKPELEERSLNYGLSFNSIGGYSSAYAMKISAVYSATNQISNAVAILPMNVIKNKNGKKVATDHSLSSVLNNRPCDYMTHFNLFKMMIESVLLNGEAFALIERDENLNVKALHYLDPINVQVLKAGKTIKYIVSGMDKAVDDINMIHLYMHLDLNSMRGISTISYGSRTLKSASEAEIHSSNFFKSGANLSGILKSTAPLNNKQKQEIRDSWSSAFSNNSGDVSVAVLPNGLDYQPISINPADSQLLESREYDVIEIARFFCISPIKLFDLSHSSYSTAEQSQLSFVSDTVFPYTVMLAEEFNKKLFRPSEVGKYEIEFDFSELLAADKKTQAEYYKTLMINGIMSLNEVREKLNLPKVEDEIGDSHYMQLNMSTLNNIVEGKNIKSPENDNQWKQNNKEEDNKE